MIVLGWDSSDKKKRKEVFFVLLKQIPNLWLSVSLSFVHKIEFIFWRKKKIGYKGKVINRKREGTNWRKVILKGKVSRKP